MGRIIVFVLFAAVTSLATTVWAQPVSAKVLGIPFGSKISISDCSAQRPITRVCWSGAVFPGYPPSSKMGNVTIPNTETLPLWAVHGQFSLAVDKSGVVDAIFVRIKDVSAHDEIFNSISLRFGKPSPTSIGTSWRSDDGLVSLVCGDECMASFFTHSSVAKTKSYDESRKRAEAARPKAP